ncbi:LOW QUALITY PROTEIN: hypothetical protein V1478_004228 [Vespula squamosa]|uniref:Uncharacterized protein n=1 Tax=Vespula squamosa TaxID=30214 RepID=A0ABD2BKG8_VESSQ
MEVTELYYMKIALKSLLKIKNKLEKICHSKYIIDHNKSERTDYKCWENAINSYKSSSSVNTINYHREKGSKEIYEETKYQIKGNVQISRSIIVSAVSRIIIYKHLRIVKGHHTIRRRSCSVLLFFLQQIKRTIKIFQELKSVYHLPLEADSNSNNIKWITLTENIQKIALGENLVDNVETYSCFDLY